VLADVEGIAMPEVAEMLGIKLNTAYSRLRAARLQFRTAISRHHGGAR
jgi:RNA polymerase sigma-70 factor (ECF subfamily)